MHSKISRGPAKAPASRRRERRIVSDKKVRPVVSCVYEVRLADEQYALIYSNARVRHVEEIVQEGKSGYRVLNVQRLKEFKIAGDFAALSVNFIDNQGKAGAVPCQLTVFLLGAGIDTESEFGNFYALSYGSEPVTSLQAPDVRLQGGLMRHIQAKILANFELDAIRSVIGDFKSTIEIGKNVALIMDTLERTWGKRLQRESMTVSRNLNSAIVERALTNLR